ncbi:MAG: glucokinase [Halioglobus sp.]|nr:glucokinase [Halioglobus sp.]
MGPSTHDTTRLVGDIGGTHTRLALFDPDSGALRHLEVYDNREHGCLQDIIAHWIEALPQAAPSRCCLAIAAPPFADEISMINIGWSFSVSSLQRRFGFAALRCINDFVGNAYALPHLGADDMTTLRPGEAAKREKVATVGPGTGLGGATLQFCGERPVVSASEPGHMGLSPATALELDLFARLLPRHGNIYAELLLSGPGLLRIYRTLAEIRGAPAELDKPAQVTDRALSGDCQLSRGALDTFCGLLGSACGDYVLATGSFGGLYLAGGIVPQFTRFLEQSDFRQRFGAKGEMAAHMDKVPLHVITSGTAGLLGAGYAPL